MGTQSRGTSAPAGEWRDGENGETSPFFRPRGGEREAETYQGVGSLAEGHDIEVLSEDVDELLRLRVPAVVAGRKVGREVPVAEYVVAAEGPRAKPVA